MVVLANGDREGEAQGYGDGCAEGHPVGKEEERRRGEEDHHGGKGEGEKAKNYFEKIINAPNFSRNWYTQEAENALKNLGD